MSDSLILILTDVTACIALSYDVQRRYRVSSFTMFQQKSLKHLICESSHQSKNCCSRKLIPARPQAEGNCDWPRTAENQDQGSESLTGMRIFSSRVPLHLRRWGRCIGRRRRQCCCAGRLGFRSLCPFRSSRQCRYPRVLYRWGRRRIAVRSWG
jgi:hypothetical protein